MNRKFIIPQIREVNSEDRTVEFVISTDTVDRHGTVLNMNNWELENFNKNGIVGYQHEVHGSWLGDSNPDSIIGKGKAWTEAVKKGKNETLQLIGEVEFEPEGMNELADKIFKKIEFGTLSATSVGFMPTGRGQWGQEVDDQMEDEDVFFFEGQELLEFSIVNIPSNPDAVKRMNEEAKPKRDDDSVTCKNCSTILDYTSIKEEGMGYIECPSCSKNIDQEGNVVGDKSTKEGEIAQNLLDSVQEDEAQNNLDAEHADLNNRINTARIPTI